MKTKTIFNIFLIGLLSLSAVAQKNKINSTEFQKTLGKWNGKLVYLDYKSNQPYEMPADLEVIQIKNSNDFKFINSYPNESSANSIDTVSISNNGKKLDKEIVKSKKNLENGDLEIITEIPGKDGNDNKKATIRHSYIIGEKVFEIKKEVLFDGAKDWVLRHTYKYSRKIPSH